MNATGLPDGTRSFMLTEISATTDPPMIGASNEPMNGVCCSSPMIGSARSPTSGILASNLSNGCSR